jgi:hypothetical protein
MVRQMLESLIVAHGEEAVTVALSRVRDHLVDKGELKHPDVIAQDAVQEHVSKFPLMSPVIRTAWNLTHGDRRKAYGTPAVVFAGYAKIWSGLLAKKLREDLTAGDVALMMTGLKLAREANSPGTDNVVDAHGYLIMHDEIKEETSDAPVHIEG